MPFCGNAPITKESEMEGKTNELLNEITKNGKEEVAISTLSELGCYTKK
jgi:hypothetical protein